MIHLLNDARSKPREERDRSSREQDRCCERTTGAAKPLASVKPFSKGGVGIFLGDQFPVAKFTSSRWRPSAIGHSLKVHPPMSPIHPGAGGGRRPYELKGRLCRERLDGPQLENPPEIGLGRLEHNRVGDASSEGLAPLPCSEFPGGAAFISVQSNRSGSDFTIPGPQRAAELDAAQGAVDRQSPAGSKEVQS